MSHLNPEEFKIMQDSMGEIIKGNRNGVAKELDLGKVEVSLGKTFEEQGIPIDPQRIKQVVAEKSNGNPPTSVTPSKKRFSFLGSMWLGFMFLIIPLLGSAYITSEIIERREKWAMQDALALPEIVMFKSYSSKGFRAIPRGQLEYELSLYKRTFGPLLKNLSVIPTQNGTSFNLEFSDVPKRDCEALLPSIKKGIDGLVVNGKEVKQFPNVSCQNVNAIVYPSNINIKNVNEG